MAELPEMQSWPRGQELMAPLTEGHLDQQSVVIVSVLEERCRRRKADAHRGARTRCCRAVGHSGTPEIRTGMAFRRRKLLLPRAASTTGSQNHETPCLREFHVGHGIDYRSGAGIVGGGRRIYSARGCRPFVSRAEL